MSKQIKYIQLAESNPAKCAKLWRSARDLHTVIKIGGNVSWACERWENHTRQRLDAQREAPLNTELVHFTSGTTGEPKPVGRTWASLDAGINLRQELHGVRWACAFPVDRMAGIQVVLSCEINDAQPVAVANAASLSAAMQYCEAGSATAAMWRVALAFGCSGSHVRQVTVGGDGADDILLNQLREAFPSARITQTYVTSEAGVICSWSDGLTGIPFAAFSRRASLTPDGQVLVARDFRACTGTDTLHTGDIAELRESRVYIIGRRDAQINVGGVKVQAESVEALVMRSCPSVVDCRASAGPNPILGQHVVLEVVCDDFDRASQELSEVSWPDRALRPIQVKRISAVHRDPQGKVIRCEF